MLVKQMFITSMEEVDPNLTIEVADLIHVHNQLLEHTDRILIRYHIEDPISLLLQELGNKPFPLPPTKPTPRLNLRISARLLLT